MALRGLRQSINPQSHGGSRQKLHLPNGLAGWGTNGAKSGNVRGGSGFRLNDKVHETFGNPLSYAAAMLEPVITKATAMLDKLLPQTIDNTYRGYKAALWLFALVVAVRITQSVLVIFNGYATARDADGIPLDTYPRAAAQTAVALFAQGSLWRVTTCLLCVLVLVRYRSAVPFMFALLLLNYLASQLIFQFVPLARTGTPPGPIANLIIFALMVTGLVLSLRNQGVRI